MFVNRVIYSAVIGANDKTCILPCLEMESYEGNDIRKWFYTRE